MEADHCYVLDRDYAQLPLLNDIAGAQSISVCRIRDDSNFGVERERSLTEAARAAGVVPDAVVRLGMGPKPKDRPGHPVRRVVVAVPPHARRGGRQGKTAGPPGLGQLLIATNLLDVPAEIMALSYRYRWLIEIFFRTLKSGCRIEQRRFEHVDRVLSCLALCLIVAWRTLLMGRRCPDVDCQAIFEPSEWKAV